MYEEDRFLRQLDIVPLDKVRKQSVSLIGCGAIGRQLAIQLAAVGVSKLELIDFDKVDDHNRTTQGYGLKDIGKYKVDCLKKYIESLYDDINVTIKREEFGPDSIPSGSTVFIATDSILARHKIWSALKTKKLVFLCDSRMLAENITVLAYREKFDEYEKTLFDPKDEEQGRCTARMTLYSASICAGLAVHQFTRYLRGYKLKNMNMNLIAQKYQAPTEGFDG